MRNPILRNARRVGLLVTTTLVVFVVTATAAIAQITGEDAEIPENPPTNWTTGWLAWPLLGLGVAVLVGAMIYYAWKMVKLRYPVES